MQPGELDQQVRQRELRQIGERKTVFVGPKLVPRLLDERRVELRRAGDNHDSGGVWMKGEHDIQRRMEGPFQEHPGHVRRQWLVTDLAAVDSAEDDRSAWKIAAPWRNRKSSDGPMTATTASIFLPLYFEVRWFRSSSR